MSNRKQDLTGLWMVPYADLMSTLVILFLALFAFAYMNRPPEYDRALAQMQEELARKTKEHSKAHSRLLEADLAVRLNEEMNRLAIREFGLLVTARRVRLVLPSPVLFREGSAELGPEAERVLKPLARLFSQVPNSVLVEGHTDNVPLFRGRHRNNWELSAARAFSVIEYFNRKGLPPQRFHARGYGEQRPAVPNDTLEGRRTNRRIEISLIRDLRSLE